MVHPLDDPHERKELYRGPGDRRRDFAARARFDTRLCEVVDDARREGARLSSYAVVVLLAAVAVLVVVLLIVAQARGCLL
jgi:hypothetical protein